MHRLDRRIQILRGKRQGAFDSDQYFQERAFRGRAARKVRYLLRRNQPVILITPRWSEPRTFLDDVGIDLSLGQPQVHCRTMSMEPMIDQSAHDGWMWLVRGIVELCSLKVQGPVAQAVDRHGFRHVMRDLFRRARTGPRRTLLIHQLQHLHVQARDDLIQVFEEHMDEFGDERRVNLLLATSVDAGNFEMKGAERVFLSDFSDVEAIEALTEYAGPVEDTLLKAAIGAVGGVPALLQRLGRSAEENGGLATHNEDIWKVLGSLADEVRGALQMIQCDDQLAERFDEVVKRGPVPLDGARDAALLRAGVLQEIYGGLSARVKVRAPVFAELAG